MHSAQATAQKPFMLGSRTEPVMFPTITVTTLPWLSGEKSVRGEITLADSIRLEQFNAGEKGVAINWATEVRAVPVMLFP